MTWFIFSRILVARVCCNANRNLNSFPLISEAEIAELKSHWRGVENFQFYFLVSFYISQETRGKFYAPKINRDKLIVSPECSLTPWFHFSFSWRLVETWTEETTEEKKYRTEYGNVILIINNFIHTCCYQIRWISIYNCTTCHHSDAWPT